MQVFLKPQPIVSPFRAATALDQCSRSNVQAIETTLGCRSVTIRVMENAPLEQRRVLGIPVPARSSLWFVALALAIVVFDQSTKWAVDRWIAPGQEYPEGWPVRLVHITNTGAAFGILQDAGPLLVIISLIGIAVILLYLFNSGFSHPVLRLGLVMMFGGAVGNLIDRVTAGEVIDFVKFPNFPAFNVADSAITIGVILLLWAIAFDRTKHQPGESSS